jgi:hypothetical protein
MIGILVGISTRDNSRAVYRTKVMANDWEEQERGWVESVRG